MMCYLNVLVYVFLPEKPFHLMLPSLYLVPLIPSLISVLPVPVFSTLHTVSSSVSIPALFPQLPFSFAGILFPTFSSLFARKHSSSVTLIMPTFR